MYINEHEIDFILKALAYCAVTSDMKFSELCAEFHAELFKRAVYESSAGITKKEKEQ